MKRLMQWLLVFSAIGASYAEAWEYSLEGRASVFLPTSHKFRDIFGDCGGMYGGVATVGTCHWKGFVTADYFSKHGRSIGLSDPTRVELVPVALGLEYHLPINHCFNCYLGIGPETVYIRTKDIEDDVSIQLSRWGYGGVARAGAIWYFLENFYLDFSADYSYLYVSAPRVSNLDEVGTSANLSGFRFGLGLGFEF